MKKNKKQEKYEPQQIQLELPDYSDQYHEWIKKQNKEIKKEETVIVIDIY